MKIVKLLFLAFVISFNLELSAQAPQSFNFQGVLRNNTGLIQANTALVVRHTVRQGSATGTSIYQETHAVSTNDYGVFTTKAGSGSVVSGTFNTIDWSTGNYYLQTEVNPASAGFSDMGASQLISVPFALYADEANKATNMALNDLTDVTSTSPTNGQSLVWNGTAWVPQTISGGSTYTAGTGINVTGTVISNTGDTNGADDITNATSAGGDLGGTYPNPSVIRLQGQSVASTTPTSGQALVWSGTQWAPATVGAGGTYSAGTGINIIGTVISNTGDANAADDITTSTSAGGDLSGTYPNPTVAQIQSRAISATAPTSGQSLVWNGSQWAPQTISGGGSYTAGTGINVTGTVITNTGDTNPLDDVTTSTNFAGDVTGLYNATNVVRLQNRTLASTAPSSGQVLKWNGVQWQPDTDLTGASSYTGGTGITITGSVINSTWTTNLNNIYSNNTGNVGVGTGAPAAKFQVAGVPATTITLPNLVVDYVNIYGNLSNISATENSAIVGYATGSSVENNGVVGLAGTGAGDNIGVIGTSTLSTSGDNYGVFGYADGNNFVAGTYGNVAANAGGTGIYGDDGNTILSNWAGYFSGDIYATGDVGGATKSWKIDHPADPANKFLRHVSMEGPEMLNFYDGVITTDGSGFATVQLPAYFETINKDFRYQLTCVGVFAQAIVSTEIQNNQFVIQTNQPNVKVSWQVTALRDDPYARANPIQNETEKSEKFKGRYLHPELYGQPEEKGFFYNKMDSKGTASQTKSQK